MLVRYPIIFFIVILILSCAIPQSSEIKDGLHPLKTKAEVGDELVYPGEIFKLEKLEYSTFDNKRKILYVGSSPNGHVFKIDINQNEPYDLIDLGVVPNDPGFDFKMTKEVLALSNDTDYLYGGTTVYPSLFFRKLSANQIQQATFEVFANEKLRTSAVYMLRAAKLITSGKFTYVVMAAIGSDNFGKIVVWKVNNKTGPTIKDMVSVINVAKGIDVTQIGATYIKGEASVIVGTTGKKVFIYNLNRERMVTNRMLNHNASIIIADEKMTDQFWVLTKSRIFKYSAINQIKLVKSFEISKNIRWAADYHVINTYYNNNIYTSTFKFNIKNSKFEKYNQKLFPQQAFCNLSVSHDDNGKLNSVFTFNGGPYFSPVKLYKMDDVESLKLNYNFQFNPYPKPYIVPYGGGPYTGLAAYDGIIYGSLAKNGTLLTYDVSSTALNDESLEEGVQADCILAFNNKIYFGMYSRPYFNWRTKGMNGSWGKKVFDLQPLIKDPNQARIKSLTGIKVKGRSLVFIGTGPASYFYKGASKPVLLVYDSKFPSKIINLGYIENADIIASLSTALSNNGNEVLIYGATLKGVFVYKYNLKSSSSKPKIIKQNNKLIASAVLVANNNLYLIETVGNTEIFKYFRLPLSNNDFSKKSASIELWRWSMYSKGQLVQGNDGNIYANVSRRNSKDNSYYNYVYKVSPNLKEKTTIVDNSGIFDSNQLVDLISVDKNKSNLDLYLSFRGGQLKRY
jgi:hypothetical protein